MNRRELFKSLSGAGVLPMVKSAERLEVKPDDIVVIKANQYISHERAERMLGHLKDRFPDHKFLFLSEGMDIEVLRRS